MITLSGFADEVHQDFRKQAEFFSQIGIGHIEIRFVGGKNILALDKEELADVKSILREYTLGISAIGSPIGKYGIKEDFTPHFDLFKKAVDIADYLETGLIRVFSYTAPAGEKIEDYRDEVLERMAKKAEYLKGSSIIMVHENEQNIYGYSAENCVDIAKEVNSPNLRLAYDPANFVWGSGITDNVERCYSIMRPFVSHIHIKDWKKGSKDIGSLPGDGDGQIELLLRTAVNDGYDGFITLEPHMSSGGKFGGNTTELQMQAALGRVQQYLMNI